jgi:hypothetical protein
VERLLKGVLSITAALLTERKPAFYSVVRVLAALAVQIGLLLFLPTCSVLVVS